MWKYCFRSGVVFGSIGGVRDSYFRTGINLIRVSGFPFFMWAYMKIAFVAVSTPRVEIQTSRTGRPSIDDDFATIPLDDELEVINGDLWDLRIEECKELLEFIILCCEACFYTEIVILAL